MAENDFVLGQLKEAVNSLQQSSADIRASVTRLFNAQDELKQQLAVLRSQMGVVTETHKPASPESRMVWWGAIVAVMLAGFSALGTWIFLVVSRK